MPRLRFRRSGSRFQSHSPILDSKSSSYPIRGINSVFREPSVLSDRRIVSNCRGCFVVRNMLAAVGRAISHHISPELGATSTVCVTGACTRTRDTTSFPSLWISGSGCLIQAARHRGVSLGRSRSARRAGSLRNVRKGQGAKSQGRNCKHGNTNTRHSIAGFEHTLPLRIMTLFSKPFTGFRWNGRTPRSTAKLVSRT